MVPPADHARYVATDRVCIWTGALPVYVLVTLPPGRTAAAAGVCPTSGPDTGETAAGR